MSADDTTLFNRTCRSTRPSSPRDAGQCCRSPTIRRAPARLALQLEKRPFDTFTTRCLQDYTSASPTPSSDARSPLDNGCRSERSATRTPECASNRLRLLPLRLARLTPRLHPPELCLDHRSTAMPAVILLPAVSHALLLRLALRPMNCLYFFSTAASDASRLGQQVQLAARFPPTTPSTTGYLPFSPSPPLGHARCSQGSPQAGRVRLVPVVPVRKRAVGLQRDRRQRSSFRKGAAASCPWPTKKGPAIARFAPTQAGVAQERCRPPHPQVGQRRAPALGVGRRRRSGWRRPFGRGRGRQPREHGRDEPQIRRVDEDGDRQRTFPLSVLRLDRVSWRGPVVRPGARLLRWRRAAPPSSKRPHPPVYGLLDG